MKVVVAVDSFKGSMTSMEAGMAVKAGILAAKKDAEVIVKPLADGGEGTTDALIEGLKGERVDVTVTGPYHEPVQAYYGYLRESNTAVMEMATAAGITLSDKKEPMTATTYGVGELILHAIGRGIRNYPCYLRRMIHIMFFLQFFIKLHTVPVLIMLRQNRLVIHRCACFPQSVKHLVKQISSDSCKNQHFLLHLLLRNQR